MSLNVGYLTSDRNNSDLFTPYYAVDPIVKYIPKDKIIWCPFDEEWSAFNRTFSKLGFHVVRSCITDKTEHDFFKYEPNEWDIIVSNPPFHLKDDILKRLYSFKKPFAVLLPLNSLQGKQRCKYFINEGIQLLTFDSRICFHDKNNMEKVCKGSPFASAYFCNNLLPRDLIVEKLNVYEKPLYDNFEEV